MRIVKAGYWGDEYLDAVKHEMGVGDGDPAPELPPGIDVPEAVKPVVEKMYQELLASEAPDPKYFLQGVQVAVLDYFDGKVEPYTRAATAAEILADGFAAEEFFSWRGGSPEYSFWIMHSNAVSDLSAMLDIDSDVLFDELGQLAVQAAAEEGTKLTQEIQEARAGVNEKILEVVDEDWEQPLAKVVALWNQFLDTEVENPRDVTVEDLMSLLGSMDDYNNQYGDFGGDFEEAAKQVLPGLARQVLLAPDPRQTEIQFPKRRGRPQKHFYKKSAMDEDGVLAKRTAASDQVNFRLTSQEADDLALVSPALLYRLEDAHKNLQGKFRERPDGSYAGTLDFYMLYDAAQALDNALDQAAKGQGRVDLDPEAAGRIEALLGKFYQAAGAARGKPFDLIPRGAHTTRRAASDQDLIERYLGTEGPEAFESIEEINEYFKPESLDYMFGPADGHPDAEAAHQAVVRAWQQIRGK